MSLGLISGYGSDSGSENEGEEGKTSQGYQVKMFVFDRQSIAGFSQVFLPSGESVEQKLKTLAEGAGLQGTGGVALSAITAPPPPPPSNPYLYQQPAPQYDNPQPLPNPMRVNPSNRAKSFTLSWDVSQRRAKNVLHGVTENMFEVRYRQNSKEPDAPAAPHPVDLYTLVKGSKGKVEESYFKLNRETGIQYNMQRVQNYLQFTYNS